MVAIIEITIEREYLSDSELLDAVNEYYEEKEASEQLNNKIKNDEYPLKGIRCAVCGSSRQ